MSGNKIYHILVVEDNTDYARALLLFLHNEGFSTNWAADTSEARRYLNKKRPDLILLDISLPDENGIEFCTRLKHDSHTSKIPVFLLSAHLEMATFISESSYGAEEYLEKTIPYDKLLTHIQKYLQ